MPADAVPTPDASPPAPASLTEPAVTSSAGALGITLEEAAQRIGWQSALSDEVKQSIADELGDHFGGLWFDTETSRITIGVVSAGATAIPSDNLQSVRRAGLTTVADTVAVQWSVADLDAVSAELGPRLARVNGRGLPCALASGQVTSLNAVLLDVPSGPLTAAQQALVQSAAARYGTKVRLRPIAGNGYAQRQ